MGIFYNVRCHLNSNLFGKGPGFSVVHLDESGQSPCNSNSKVYSCGMALEITISSGRFFFFFTKRYDQLVYLLFLQ